MWIAHKDYLMSPNIRCVETYYVTIDSLPRTHRLSHTRLRVVSGLLFDFDAYDLPRRSTRAPRLPISARAGRNNLYTLSSIDIYNTCYDLSIPFFASSGAMEYLLAPPISVMLVDIA
jgi:hypothetical protein